MIMMRALLQVRTTNRQRTRAEKLRLIGVDTPETVHPNKPTECYGPEASAFTTRCLLAAAVYVELDQEQRDKYDRLLGYIRLDSGEMFNRTLLVEGYAIEKHYHPNTRYQSNFQAAEAEARTAGRGLWAVCR